MYLLNVMLVQLYMILIIGIEKTNSRATSLQIKIYLYLIPLMVLNQI